jgi:predicted AAA+ superfamily ATPase
MDNDALLTADALYRYISDRLVSGAINYIFFDEIQMVLEFPRVVDSLFLKKNVDLYITGSNQNFLSSELATLLSGRYVTISMTPLSFREYVDFHAPPQSENLTQSMVLPSLYEDYLRFSSFPFTMNLGRDLNMVKEYLGGIYNTVIMKDIAARRGVMDMITFDSVTRFIFDNIGNLTTIKKISDTMASSGRKISVPTIEIYLNSLLDAFLVYRARRFDLKGKRQLLVNDKFYVIDMGLRSYLLGEKSLDISHTLENVVYLELLRRGYEVFVGKIDSLEVDFVAMKAGVSEYYQISATIRDSSVLERELTPLKKIRDNFPKFILTLDRDPPAYHDGIRSKNALDFLVEEW